MPSVMSIFEQSISQQLESWIHLSSVLSVWRRSRHALNPYSVTYHINSPKSPNFHVYITQNRVVYIYSHTHACCKGCTNRRALHGVHEGARAQHLPACSSRSGGMREVAWRQKHITMQSSIRLALLGSMTPKRLAGCYHYSSSSTRTYIIYLHTGSTWYYTAEKCVSVVFIGSLIIPVGPSVYLQDLS